jgi:hypothetical protein
MRTRTVYSRVPCCALRAGIFVAFPVVEGRRFERGGFDVAAFAIITDLCA